MPKFRFAKLVRDNIVDNQIANGARPTYHQLDAAEHKRLLVEKIVEEAREIAAAPADELASEIADVQQALDDLREMYGLPPEHVTAAQAAKRQKNGAFKRGIYIDY